MNPQHSKLFVCVAACALMFACSKKSDDKAKSAKAPATDTSKTDTANKTTEANKASPVKMQCKKIIELAEAEDKKTRKGKDDVVARAKAQAAFVSACETKFEQSQRDCMMKALTGKDRVAFRKCMRNPALAHRGKNMEAKIFIKKIRDGARTYYLDPNTARGGISPRPPQFPGPSAALTPAAGSCCKGKESKCAPEQTQWSTPTWIALGFSLDDPHYYSYSYTVNGKNFTARAVGDLDCDGKYSTFELRGSADGKTPAKITVKDALE